MSLSIENDRFGIAKGITEVGDLYGMGHLFSVRVPRENLLNRYSDVDPNGNFSSKIAGRRKYVHVSAEDLKLTISQSSPGCRRSIACW